MQPPQHPPPPGAALYSVLTVKRRSCEVTLDPGRALLCWRDVRPRRGAGSSSRAGGHNVPVCEIVSVGEAEIDEKYFHSMKWQHMFTPHAFTVHYVQRAQKHRWRCKAVTFWCSDERLCFQWLQALHDLLEQQTCRPKHLLVYINPYSGKKKGKQIYEQKVAPLFSLASISADVIGSTDCVCFATVGANDPVTSALHIIIGDSQSLDVCSVHHKQTFLKYSVSLLGYGFYGDVLKGSEKNRWMGPARYDFSGFKTFLSHHYYEGTVSFEPDQQALGSPRDQICCTSGCFICRQSIKQLEKRQRKQPCGLEHDGQEEDWTIIKGKFMAINAANMSCACPRSPKGLSPAAHLADGTADLILVRKCSRLNFLRHLIRHTRNDDQFDFAFVEVYRVKTFQFTPKHFEEEDCESTETGKKNFAQICTDHPRCGCSQVNSIWNCDGETLDQTAIEVRYSMNHFCQLMC
ncbi:hypothetical protein FKM82_012774 [Ascaphus truei]